MYFARVVKGNDLILGYQWYVFDYENDNREPTYTRTIFSWEFPYSMINQLNLFIDGVKKSTNLSPLEKDEFLGQGYTLRAFYYFQLAMEFQHTYSYDPSLPAPPIYEEPALEGKAMSTLSELYDFILSDLYTAIQTTPENRIDKSYINRKVANAILARVHQVMGNWEEAAKVAAAAAKEAEKEAKAAEKAAKAEAKAAKAEAKDAPAEEAPAAEAKAEEAPAEEAKADDAKDEK